MKKVLSLLTILIFSANVLFAANGLMSGAKDIKYVSTKWFDIIYSETSSKSAARLAEQADSIYEDICTDMQIAPTFRMPVVISSSTTVFNAYFTNATYNHIVLYDAVPEEGMAVNADNIVDTFKHELNHAVTINMQSKFWKSLSSFFGDAVNFGNVFVSPSFMKEGSAVAYESKNGNGRLNDEYYLQLVRQAKIENKFPSWRDVLGSRDKYPSGDTSYAYGGPFTDFIQKKYGMEKYSKFWYNAINNSFTLNSSFYKAYGFNMDVAWKEFEDSIAVPQVDSNPLTVDGISDFFNFGKDYADDKVLSQKNNKGSLYSNLTESEKGIAYIDDYANKVWYCEKNEDGTFKKPHCLFDDSSMSKISLSEDGAFLAVSNYDINSGNYLTSVSIYNMKTQGFFALPDKNIRDAAIFTANEKYYASCVKTVSQKVSLAIYELLLDDGKIKSSSLVKEIPLGEKEIAYSVSCNSENSIVFISKKEMTWTIKILENICGDAPMQTTTYALPKDNMRIRNVSLVSNESHPKFSELDEPKKTYAFSYTVTGSMPRLGFLVTQGESKLFELMSNDISGGVYYPVAYRVADSNSGQLPSVAYTTVFSTDKKLFVMNSAKIPFDEFPASIILSYSANDISSTEKLENQNEKSILESAKPYNDFYYNKGLLLPMGTVSLYDRTFNLTNSLAFPGLTWVTSNPWDSDFFTASVGYDFLTTTGGASLGLYGNNPTSVFNYNVTANGTFDGNGFKQFSSVDSVEYNIMIGKVTALTFVEQAFVFFGRQQDVMKMFASLMDIEYEEDSTKYISGVSQTSIQLSNVHKTGPGTYEKLGATALATYQICYFGKMEDSFNADNIYQNIFPTISFQTPKLIPIDCAYGYTYNLPFAFTASLFPDVDSFLTSSAEVVVFSKEIQRGMMLFNLYANRFTALLNYSVDVLHENETFEILNVTPDITTLDGMTLSDYVEAKFIIDLAYNSGVFASSNFVSHIGLSVQYYLHSSEGPFKITFTNKILF